MKHKLLCFQNLQREITLKELTPKPLLFCNSNISSIATFIQNKTPEII